MPEWWLNGAVSKTVVVFGLPRVPVGSVLERYTALFLKPDTRRSNQFFDDYLEIWLDAFMDDRKARGYAKATIGFYLDKLKLFSKYTDDIALKQISNITPQVIREYLLWLVGRGHTVGGIHAAYRGLRTFLLWYADENDLPNSPISKVPAPRVPVEPHEGVSLETVKELAKTSNLRDKAIFYALLDTGCRAGEFLSINVSDLNQVTGEILLRETKSKKPRMVFLGKHSRQAVRRYLKTRQDTYPALWITVRGDRLSYEGLRYIVIRRSKFIGIQPPALHDFRRGFALAMNTQLSLKRC